MTTAGEKEVERKAAIAADHAVQAAARLDPYPVYVTDAELDAAGGGGGGAVSSVDGQTGAVDLSGTYAPLVPVKRSWFRSAPEAVGAGPLHALTWTKISGENLFDLTDPTTPLALLDGMYSITVNICASAGQAGFANQPVLIELDVDEMGDDATASQSMLLTGGSIAPQGSMSMSYFVPAGGVVHAYVNHNEGGETWDFFLEAAVVWQSATAEH